MGIYAGLDIGKQRDYSALAIGSVEGHSIAIIDLIQFRLGKYPKQEVKELYKQYRWTKIGIDYTGEKSFTDELTFEGMPTEQIIFSANSKNDMINFLWSLVKDKRITIPAKLTELKSQMLEQQRITTTATVRYDHPQGHHDDQFWALCICCYAARAALSSELIGFGPRDLEAIDRQPSGIRLIEG